MGVVTHGAPPSARSVDAGHGDPSVAHRLEEPPQEVLIDRARRRRWSAPRRWHREGCSTAATVPPRSSTLSWLHSRATCSRSTAVAPGQGGAASRLGFATARARKAGSGFSEKGLGSTSASGTWPVGQWLGQSVGSFGAAEEVAVVGHVAQRREPGVVSPAEVDAADPSETTIRPSSWSPATARHTAHSRSNDASPSSRTVIPWPMATRCFQRSRVMTVSSVGRSSARVMATSSEGMVWESFAPLVVQLLGVVDDRLDLERHHRGPRRRLRGRTGTIRLRVGGVEQDVGGGVGGCHRGVTLDHGPGVEHHRLPLATVALREQASRLLGRRQQTQNVWQCKGVESSCRATETPEEGECG